MTYQQIGAFPHKACCHTENRPGCLHCAADVEIRAGQSSGTIKSNPSK